MTRIVLLALVLSTGCKIANEQSCQLPENADKPACMGIGPGPECTDNSECAGTGTPVCNVEEETCVQCLDSDDCTGSATAPICNANHTCEGCSSDNQCPSGVCLDDGACASDDSVIFASFNGSDSAGCGLTSTDPCNLPRAIAESTPQRNLVKMAPDMYIAGGTEGFIVDGNMVSHQITLLARDATIKRTSVGVAVTVKNGGKLVIAGGTIQEGLGNSGHGVQCTSSTLAIAGTTIADCGGIGVRADTCGLTVTNATVRANNFGGISVNSGTFVIVGNFVHLNGRVDSNVGGIKVDTVQAGGNRLDFNTVNNNNAGPGVGKGLDCVAGIFVARNNIVFGNGDTVDPQVDGGCKVAFSDIGPANLLTLHDGGDNVNMDPMFVDELTDLHLMPASPVVGMADPASSLNGVAAVDLDGDERTSPPDMGADELP